jgi:hypothetical protein
LDFIAHAMTTTSQTESSPFTVRQPLNWGDPLRWLALGWADLRAAPGVACSMAAAFGAWRWCWAGCSAVSLNM